jgi:3-oxoacyl-[acyl-carrier protein] reductase
MPDAIETIINRLPPSELVQKPLNELVDLHGKRIAVTGGHGPNLGQAIVHRVAALGASVALIHRVHSADAANKLAAEVREHWGVTAVPVEGDMSDWDSAHKAANEVAEKLGGLDVWVDNAGAGRDPLIDVVTDGTMHGAIEFSQASQEAIDQSMTVLLKTVFYGTHAALGVMIPQKHGRIINIASAAAFSPIKGQVLYATMKSAIVTFSEFIAREIGPDGVTIVCVAPGTIIGDARIAELSNVDDDGVKLMAEVWGQVSIGRGSRPEEPANMIAFLASDAAAYVHGTTIKVAGGR